MRDLVVTVTKVGFTGSRRGMTQAQKDSLAEFMCELKPHTTQFHHGDCIGADAEAHALALRHRLSIYIHPPSDAKHRAFCIGNEFPALPYLHRNRKIVDACELLIAAPPSEDEAPRSGTWSTVRYARYINRQVLLIFPTGNMLIGGIGIWGSGTLQHMP